ncbi:MAG: polysaccharide biosynthesis/export family protein [Caulobacteraceae bacterium]
MRIIALAAALIFAFSPVAQAQTTLPDNPASSTAAPLPQVAAPIPTAPVAGSLATPIASAGVTTGTVTTSDGVVVPVFGVDLFSGAFAGTRPGDRPDYRIQTGDQISVTLYGALNASGVQAVDATGNVMVPGVGPVQVAGITVAQLQPTILTKVRSFYTGSVGVYASVVQAGSIGVFVTGDVAKPGRYLGGARDNVLFFLSQAGGIDPARGSFRTVVVQRNGAPIATYDLYEFAINGQLPEMRFQDGDTIVVAPRSAMIGVTGAARNAYAFEAPPGGRRMTGADVIALARPDPTANNVSLRGFRGGQPQSAYYNLQDFARVVLGDGDHVEFRSDAFVGNITVKLQGELIGPSVIVLPRGATLSQLLARVPLQGTDIEPRFVHIQRPEVATEQKRALNEALFNLQKQVLTTAPLTAEQAQLTTAQAALVSQFVARAQSVQPDGNISVYTNGQFNDIRLRDNDTVVLPNRTDVVIVTGEILNPGALAWASNASIKTYVGRAGGFASNANKRKVVIRHRDGSAEVASTGTKPGPGDEVVVLPKVGNQWLVLAKDLTQILFQIAVTAGTVIRLTDSNP